MSIASTVTILLFLVGAPTKHPVWGASQIAEAIEEASDIYDVPPYLLLALALQDSHFNPQSRTGLWYLPPGSREDLKMLCGLEPAHCPTHYAYWVAKSLQEYIKSCESVNLALAGYKRQEGCGGQKRYVSEVNRELRYVRALLEYN